ncbi:MAG: type VI secretion system baseplate subunit TssF [Gammaproteobacteria bacterium]
MNPRLLKYYNRELQYIREMGGEFAKEFPKIAGRLGLDGFECADPYVERLLEGFGFMAARVQLKVDAEFPHFTQHLMELVYPHYLAPAPSMAVVQLQPDLAEGALSQGIVVPRDTALRSLLGKGDQTACEYRTGHDVTLWPLELAAAEYLATGGAVSALEIPDVQGVKAGIRLVLRATGGLTFDKLSLETLVLYLRRADERRMRIYEQFLANALGVVARPHERRAPWQEVIAKSHIRRVGFRDEEALLPHGPRSFQGYRLLHEYFVFPDRYLFVSLGGLEIAVRRCGGSELELIVLLNSGEPSLEHTLSVDDFALFCTPAINLFPKRADRIHLNEREHEYHVLPDRTRPMDFEVFAITGVTGYGASTEFEQEFLPFYASNDLTAHHEHQAFYTLHREPRQLSSKQRTKGPRSSYIGSEVYAALVDTREAPYRSDLRQLAVNTLCTNRDLPLRLAVGKGKTDFTLESGAPVSRVRILSGPTKPRPSAAERETAWRLISHLSLNYLSLMDSDERQGAAALRDLLMLYGEVAEAPTRKQIEGVRSVRARPVIRRVPTPGPITVARGLEVTVICDEGAFEGTGVFLLGAVLEQFFAKYVSINSFTETVIRGSDRGEIMRWPVSLGRREIL